MVDARIYSAAWSPTEDTTEVSTLVLVNGYERWRAKDLVSSVDPEEINSILDEQLTSARAFVALVLKGGRR